MALARTIAALNIMRTIADAQEAFVASKLGRLLVGITEQQQGLAAGGHKGAVALDQFMFIRTDACSAMFLKSNTAVFQRAALALAIAAVSSCGDGVRSPPSGPSATLASEQALGFVVRFEPPHPLAEAQALEAAGRCAEAAALARATLATRSELGGLCFDRFTLGGTEIVLGACEPPQDIELFQRAWLERLRAMDGVAYADPNATAQAIECAG
jgi:hypothetical protein